MGFSVLEAEQKRQKASPITPRPAWALVLSPGPLYWLSSAKAAPGHTGAFGKCHCSMDLQRAVRAEGE